MQPRLRVLATLALKAPLEQARPDLEAAAGMKLDIDCAPTADIVQRISHAEPFDAVVLSRTAVDDGLARGVFAAARDRDVARSTISAAVKAGSAHPDIGTLQSFQAALLDARSVAYSRTGISGVHFARLLDRLGIAREVNARARVLDGGLTGTLLVDGSCDLAIQQTSELRAVTGIDIVGPLPDGAQLATVFSAAERAGTRHAGAVAALFDALASPGFAERLEAGGLEPIRASLR